MDDNAVSALSGRRDAITIGTNNNTIAHCVRRVEVIEVLLSPRISLLMEDLDIYFYDVSYIREERI